MKSTALILASFLCMGGLSAIAADVTIEGDVVRYEPGHVLVLRDTGGREVSYTLAPNVVVPADIATGHRVTIYTGAEGGSTVVTRVTTSLTPSGDVKRTVERDDRPQRATPRAP